jgi:hypothetical protein
MLRILALGAILMTVVSNVAEARGHRGSSSSHPRTHHSASYHAHRGHGDVYPIEGETENGHQKFRTRIHAT